jgi:DNA-binding transcriptional regulator YdaS (Cro superfamily)
MTYREFRAALGQLRLSQVAFAATLGVHPVTVARWAGGALAVPRYAAAYLELAIERQTTQT